MRGAGLKNKTGSSVLYYVGLVVSWFDRVGVDFVEGGKVVEKTPHVMT